MIVIILTRSFIKFHMLLKYFTSKKVKKIENQKKIINFEYYVISLIFIYNYKIQALKYYSHTI